MFRANVRQGLRALETFNRLVDTEGMEDLAPRMRVDEALGLLKERLGPGETRGQEFWPCCPFHQDDQPGSFSVNTETGVFYCFVCGAAGGVPRLMQRLGFTQEEIRETTSQLDLNQLGLLLNAAKRDKGKERLWELPETLLSPWSQLWPTRYVERGHPDRVLRQMEVGFDEKRLRATFPVRDSFGILRGVQTRHLGPSTAKGLRWKWYKAEVLQDLGEEYARQYGLSEYEPPRRTSLLNEHCTLPALTQGRLDAPLVINEGPGHVMRSLSIGYPALGTFGTNVSPGQLRKILEALGKARQRGANTQVIVAFDADAAGWKAGVELALRMQSQVEACIAPLLAGKDPEDHSPRELFDCYRQARPLTHWLHAGGEIAETVQKALSSAMTALAVKQERAEKAAAWEQRVLSHRVDDPHFLRVDTRDRRYAPSPPGRTDALLALDELHPQKGHTKRFP